MAMAVLPVIGVAVVLRATAVVVTVASVSHALTYAYARMPTVCSLARGLQALPCTLVRCSLHNIPWIFVVAGCAPLLPHVPCPLSHLLLLFLLVFELVRE